MKEVERRQLHHYKPFHSPRELICIAPAVNSRAPSRLELHRLRNSSMRLEVDSDPFAYENRIKYNQSLLQQIRTKVQTRIVAIVIDNASEGIHLQDRESFEDCFHSFISRVHRNLNGTRRCVDPHFE